MVKLCIVSDTHGKHESLILPNADIIIHCGDMTSMGKEFEIENFFKWFSSLNQFKHKICIAGNHDWLFETNSLMARNLIPNNIIYLEDSGMVINGLKFYGTPVQKIFNNWAFNRSEEKLLKHWKAIPGDVDVLITHTPPYMILDYVKQNKLHEGSLTLRNEVIQRIKPQIHCFGHIHESYGIVKIGETVFINASNLNSSYQYTNNPITITI